jgi:LAO/AO transport system kinase
VVTRRSSIEQLVSGLVAGDRGSVARALNLLEDRRPRARAEAAELLTALPKERLRSSGHLVGITGPPGVGKSSLASALIRHWRSEGRRVGILAVDPSSPLSGGALLGDRLRMLRPEPDPNLFIRSLAGRGELGGLSADVFPMSQVMLAAFDVVLVETIGVGQTEVDVVMHTDTTCLVAQPASGDMIQFLKAGIVELPVIFAVNKADLGLPAQRAASELRVSLPRDTTEGGWQVPVLLVSARDGQGTDELAQSLDAHRAWLAERGALFEQRREHSAAWGLKRLTHEFGKMHAWLIRPERFGEPMQAFQKEVVDGAGDRRRRGAGLRHGRRRQLQQCLGGAGHPGQRDQGPQQAGRARETSTSAAATPRASSTRSARTSPPVRSATRSSSTAGCGTQRPVGQGRQRPDVLADFRIWGYETNYGSFAQFTKVQAHQCMPKPKHMTWEAAAAYMLVGATAYRMLMGWADTVKEGDVA